MLIKSIPHILIQTRWTEIGVTLRKPIPNTYEGTVSLMRRRSRLFIVCTGVSTSENFSVCMKSQPDRDIRAAIKTGFEEEVGAISSPEATRVFCLQLLSGMRLNNLPLMREMMVKKILVATGFMTMLKLFSQFKVPKILQRRVF